MLDPFANNDAMKRKANITDPLGAARGIIFASLLGAAMWLPLIVAVWRLS